MLPLFSPMMLRSWLRCAKPRISMLPKNIAFGAQACEKTLLPKFVGDLPQPKQGKHARNGGAAPGQGRGPANPG